MNPNKCAFGVSAGQFLGFMVHQWGIEISRRSIDAINKVVAPTSKTELQSLIGKINFIRRFISNLSGKIKSFSPLPKLKADQEFVWGMEQQLVLDEIKNYLINPPVRFHLSMENPSDYTCRPMIRLSVQVSFKNLKGKNV